MVIMPLLAFSIMHSASFLIKISNETTFGLDAIKTPIEWIKSKNVFLLQFIAMNEIFLLPITIYLAFTGNGIFLPVIYYRFMVLRYSSERNPYSRMTFYHLRIQSSNFANKPSCPG